MNRNKMNRNKMNRNKFFSLFPLLFIATSFVIIIVIACSLQKTTAGNREEPQIQQTSIDMSQGRALMEQFSMVFENAAAKVNPSVVPIFAEQEIPIQSFFSFPDDPFRDFFGEDFFKHFFGMPPQEKQEQQKQTVRSLGSGVIVTKDGYILTNNHVVAASKKLTVILPDKKKYDAEVIGTDPQTDVAVIKISGRDLPVAILGDSNDVKVGQWVIAVGNPFQLMHTVTAGIISAKGRSSIGLADYEDFIQTDASINPGNSGGALANLDGKIIGINTAINSPSGGNVGIGFAIPINMAKTVMGELISKGEVSRGYLALLPQDINDDLAKALKLKSTEGALVGDVTPGGPADKAGIQRGDIIIKFDNEKVENSTQLRNMVAQTDPGTEAEITLIRDGRKLNVSVTLGERPKERSGQAVPKNQKEEQSSQKLGLSIQTLTPDIARQLGYENDHGVLITSVFSGSAADEAGLQRGDLIKEVNRVRVGTIQDFNRQLSRLQSGDTAALLVRRGENTFYVAVEIPTS